MTVIDQTDRADRATQIISAIRRLAAATGEAPTRQEYTAYPDRPGLDWIFFCFGSWRNAVRAAGLTPRTSRRKGDAAKHRSQEEVDALLVEEFPGWTPGPESAHYLQEALLGEGGLAVARVIDEPVWDWNRKAHVAGTRYLLK